MAQETAPQLHLLSHEPRRKALRSGLGILLSRTPRHQYAFPQDGDGNNHKAPNIHLLRHEPRRRVVTGGLAILLRKSPALTSILQVGVSSNGHKIPGFRLLSHEPRRKAIFSGFRSLFLRKPPPQPLIVGRNEVGNEVGPKFTAMFSSSLLHFAIVFFLLAVPFWTLLPHHTENIRLPRIVYEFHEIELPANLPSIKPPGPGGKPGKGTHPGKMPARGSTAFHHNVTVVSNPPHPDNNFQTIIQPHVNPAKEIHIRLHLPNLVLSQSVQMPKPAPPAPPAPMKLSVPRTLNSLTIPRSSVVALNAPKLNLPPSDTPDMPAVPVPPPPLPPLAHRKVAPKSLNLTAIATEGVQATANGAVTGLLSLSLLPAPPSKKLSIPAGNRYGAFTISPAGKHAGSPNGSGAGSTTAGSGGPGNGGDTSTGVGSGTIGGGGGGAASANGLTVSTSGNSGAAGTAAAGRLSAAMLAKLVYPILRPPPKNRFAMVVTAGPMGGGGLHVFGVLKGGKIYTIFLPMPDRNWILQYSLVPKPDKPKKLQQNGATIQISFGIVPPAIEKRFNFHHPKLTGEQKSRMIILHGFISAKGAVTDLTVYRGVQNVANQAAMAAFSKWKFEPAIKSGKPIPIEILLGIPLG